ncbi:MAG: hypothetical protein ACRD2E_14520 [Terriglobales bacterium]
MIFVPAETPRVTPLAATAPSSELNAARAIVPVLAARLDWSATLRRRVAYLPDGLWRQACGLSVQAVRGYYGADVLVVPDSIRLP